MVVGLALVGCTPPTSELVVVVPEEHLAVFEEFVRFSGHPGLTVATAGGGRVRTVVLTEDEDCRECYRLAADETSAEVHGGDLLGLQYGLTDVLEHMGFRFFHPHRNHVPITFGDVADHPRLGQLVVPETDQRRGLHLHTLHPTEGLYDFWEATPDGLERAKQVVDWVVKGRGNHLQWVALSEIGSTWTDHTQQIVDAAHARGLTVGLGVQLYGSGNLQRAFDLVDGQYDAAEVASRLGQLGAVRPDLINLSFGEFSAEDPDRFVAEANQATDQIGSMIPSAEVTTVIHVGNYEDLRISYQGEEMLYYFLAQFIEGTTPWVHSVMYYNLFEDAGGAYLHDEFDEHRAFLIDRLTAGDPVGYFPESAYWVAFDINVPTYLPVYLRSRHTDLASLADLGLPLSDHVLFSSGWEWGYWQNDYATLRYTHTLPDDPGDALRDMYAPFGEDGALLAEVLVELMDLQHTALIVDRLAPYLAGREAVIDFGDTIGILSQPDRPSFEEIVAMDPAGLDEVQRTSDALADLADATDALAQRAADLGATSTWFDEARDGIAVDEARARFASAVLASAVHLGRGDADAAEDSLQDAEATLDRARSIVAGRHADLRWGGGSRILEASDANASVYQFGYLAKAESLCFWEREQVQLSNLVREQDSPAPPCT